MIRVPPWQIESGAKGLGAAASISSPKRVGGDECAH